MAPTSEGLRPEQIMTDDDLGQSISRDTFVSTINSTRATTIETRGSSEVTAAKGVYARVLEERISYPLRIPSDPIAPQSPLFETQSLPHPTDTDDAHPLSHDLIATLVSSPLTKPISSAEVPKEKSLKKRKKRKVDEIDDIFGDT
jgi:hypothetical protein